MEKKFFIVAVLIFAVAVIVLAPNTIDWLGKNQTCTQIVKTAVEVLS